MVGMQWINIGGKIQAYIEYQSKGAIAMLLASEDVEKL